MPVLANVSKSDILELIWSASISLSAMSLLVLSVLIFRRFYQEYVSVKAADRKKELTQYMRAAMINPKVITEKALPPLMRGDEEVVCEAALDILRNVRGEDEKNITKLLQTWDVIVYLRKTLKHGSRGKQIQALTILAHFDDADTLQLLLDHVESKDIYVQLAALRGLALRNAVSELPKIIKYLEKSEQRNVLMLADILQRFGRPARDYIGELANSKANKEIRISAIIAIGKISSLKSAKVLIKLAEDKDNDVAAQAIYSLGEIGNVSANKVVLKKLTSKNPAIKVHAIRAAGKMGLEDAIPDLVDHLADKNWWVRFRAANALTKLGSKGVLMLKASMVEEGHAGEIADQVLREKGLMDA